MRLQVLGEREHCQILCTQRTEPVQGAVGVTGDGSEGGIIPLPSTYH